ncbi:MAG: hypothetical protein RL154_579 [Pseudomonadota bacterium]|jgi:2,3,4,5-tetrahydropyridine-2-carboxylate N-succinyltransferase
MEEFKQFVLAFEQTAGYKKPLGFGIARLERGQLNKDKILQATFPVLNWNENFGSFASFANAAIKSGVMLDWSATEWVIDVNSAFVDAALEAFECFIPETSGDKHRNIQILLELKKLKKLKNNFVFVVLFEDVQALSIPVGYMKLYALSTGKAEIRSLNLNGIFGLLHNCAWSDGKPYELDYLRLKEIKLKVKNEFPHIDFVDKFPRYLQHIIPFDNVRILDTAKVRFGAQIGAGTTIMPGASYVNFNAGTIGKSMIEGRVSSSVTVGEGSDVGGGGSILGVLSGTNGNAITIGKNCLVGANAVCGIPLGDASIIDGGIAVLEGTKLFIKDSEMVKIKEVNEDKEIIAQKVDGGFIVKGLDIGGAKGIHFRQDSQNGRMIAARSRREIKLNADLH